jgi:aminopeptidase N
MPVEDPELLHLARETLKSVIARRHSAAFHSLYHSRRDNAPFPKDASGSGRRSLKNTALDYVGAVASDEAIALVKSQFDAADNMTDRMAALSTLRNLDHPARAQALDAFAARHQGDAIVLDKWLSVQAASALPNAVATVRGLLSHPIYDAKNPNRIRALVGTFALRNPVHFHAADGSGYEFLADQIVATDRFNPQTAARLLPPLGRWKRFDLARQAHMKAQLARIVAVKDLSRDVYELATKSLEG